jgi:predicted membrane protein
MFTKLATLLVENEELLKTLGVVVGIAAAAFVVYKVAALAATASTIGFSGAVLKLNAIMAE